MVRRARAALGLGGNVGDVPASMASALKSLDARPDLSVAKVSRLYRTPPWGKLDQPDFVNACALVDTSLAPHALLDLCLQTERAHLRERRERWGPRTLDIDLLDYGGEAISDERLTLPHPRAGERAFVLVPLAEIAPDLSLGGCPVGDPALTLDPDGIEPMSLDGTWWHAVDRPAG